MRLGKALETELGTVLRFELGVELGETLGSELGTSLGATSLGLFVLGGIVVSEMGVVDASEVVDELD